MQRFAKPCPPGSIPGQARWARLLLALAVTVLWSVGSAGPASAQYVTPEPPLTGASTDVQAQPVIDVAGTAGSGARSVAQVDGATVQAASRSNGSGLPVTGGDVVGLTAMGVGAIAAGGLILHFRRRATRV
jgi:LPXTG-motif cell wall-anchored protein